MSAQKERTQPGGAGSRGANAGQADGDAKHTAIPSVDIDEARRFLRALDPAAERFHFRTLPEGGRPGKGHKFDNRSLDEVEFNLARDNGNGHGVFVVVNEGGQTAAAITRVRAVWADFDDTDVVARLNFSELNIDGQPPHMVVQSSPGKVHVYWKVDGLELAAFNGVQEAIAARYGSDRSVADLPRIMRLPGFIHHKGAPHLTRLVGDAEARGRAPLSAAAVLAAFPPAVVAAGAVAIPAPAGSSSSNAHLVASIHRGESLHDSTRDYAFRLLADGMKPSKVVETVRGIMETMPDRGDSARWQERYDDIPRMVAEGEKKLLAAGPVAATAGRVLSFRRVDELIANPKPPTWLIRRFLERDTLALVFGDPGVGKSFLAVEWAVCVVTGTPFNGRKVARGPVLFVAGEGLNGLGRRFQACASSKGVDLAGAPLFVSTMASAMTDPDAVGELLEIVDAHTRDNGGESPVLVVVDTVARNFGPGDENSTKDMTAFINACDALREQTGACVLLVHHSGHADKTRARGSIALKGALDWEYGLARDPSGVLHLQCTKAKDSEPPAMMALRLSSFDLGIVDDEGEPVTSAVLSPAAYLGSASKGKAGRGKRQVAALRLLKEGLTKLEAEIVAGGGDPDTARLRMADWRAACLADGIPANRFNELVKSLGNQGLICIVGDYVTPQDPGLAVI